MSDTFQSHDLQHFPLELNEIPSNWKVSSLQDLSLVLEPGFASGKQNQDDSGVPHLRPMNIDRDGKIDLSVVKRVPTRSDKSLRENDVLFNNTNSPELVGKTAFISAAEKDFAFSNHMTRLTSSVLVNSRYIAYYLHFLWQSGYTKHRCTNHVNQASVSTTTLGNTFPVLVPPEKEQTRIVEKLEELLSDLDNGVVELKAAQLKLAQYRQSLLKSAVEGSLTEEWRQQNTPIETGAQLLERILKERRQRWEEEKLAEFKAKDKNPPKNWKDKYPEPVQPDTSELPELPEGWVWATIDQLALNKRYGSSSKTNDDSSGIPVLRMGNIQDGAIDYDSLKYLPKDHSEFPDLLLKDGDLLFNRTNSAELVGKTAVYRDIGKPCSYASYLISVTFSESFLPEIAAYLINSTLGKAWVASVMNQTAGQANVNGTKLGALAIPLAPLEEQKHLVSEMHNLRNDLESQSNAVQLGLKQSEAQRKNILKDAFSGKLVPQDPNDEPASVLLERIKNERELLAQQPKRKTSKKKTTMKKKPDSSLLVRDWIVKQSAPFTFEQLSAAVDLEYEDLQDELFKLLSASSPIVTQAFDKSREYIVFKVIES